MQLLAIQRILGLLMMLFSITMLPPILVSLIYGDEGLVPFVDAFGLILGSGLLMYLPVFSRREELRLRDGFLIVVLFWLVLGLCGAVPLVISESPHLSLTDAVFESMSGLTTTGATVLSGLDTLPPSILYYRQQLQWLGGMGIIVLAVAILPMLGIGGMQLYRAETPGPMKDDKLTPRITETAKALWYIYLSLTIVCAIAYWLAGMEPFDAIGHSYATVGIGGFSTHDASLGYFNNPLIEVIAMVFMVIAGANFALHFRAWHQISIRHYLQDAEFRTFATLLFLIAVFSSIYLYTTATYGSFLEALRYGFFQTISISTTAGFATTGFDAWPSLIPVLLIFSSFVGGCAGSTGGGLKVIRILLLFKQGMGEIQRLIHPNAIITIKIGRNPVPERIINAVWGFFATYVAVFTFIMLALLFTGLDQVTAFSATAATLNNLGPGLGSVAENYGSLTDGAKWVLSASMILGRLEIFTLLVILTPAFWR